MQNYCPCGNKIPMNKELCPACAEIYGTNREEYPQWLVEWLRDYRREQAAERRYAEHEVQFTDMGDDLEDYIWSNV